MRKILTNENQDNSGASDLPQDEAPKPDTALTARFPAGSFLVDTIHSDISSATDQSSLDKLIAEANQTQIGVAPPESENSQGDDNRADDTKVE